MSSIQTGKRMTGSELRLIGQHIRLEPLSDEHCEGLVAAAQAGGALYQWSPIPRTAADVQRYIDVAVSWRAAGTAIPFATVRANDEVVIGSTRFWNIERWTWPQGHPRHGREYPDACEIGYTWLAPAAIRTAANTEAKALMLAHAFDVWQVLRVCFHTDARNARSRAALERIGAKFEGILRAHRIAADFTSRDSARYSILAGEWPGVRERLNAVLIR
jgi:N-acetyltransferase